MNRYWAAFWLMGFIYGSSFLFNSIALREVNPLELGFLRYTIAALGLHVYLGQQRKYLRLDRKLLGILLLIGLANHALPFTLILWAQTRLASGLAAVFMATVPLFNLIFAHFSLADERMTAHKTAGVLLGFTGALILASRSFTGGGVDSDLLAELAILAASALAAIGTIYSRHVLRGRTNIMFISAGAATTSAMFMLLAISASWLAGLGASPIFFSNLSRDTWLAALVVGIASTLIANSLFYYVIGGLGASNTTLVTYVFPPISLLLGTVFLDEIIDARIILGMLVIFSGLALINRHATLWQLPQRWRVRPAK